MIKARNEFVKAGLQRAYAEKVENKTLEVFGVSNKTYEKYTRKGNAQFVDASGIPELRRFCHSINAHAQLGESRNFLLSKLPSLLSSVRLWTENIAREEDHSASGGELQEKLLRSVEETQNEVCIASS